MTTREAAIAELNREMADRYNGKTPRLVALSSPEIEEILAALSAPNATSADDIVVTQEMIEAGEAARLEHTDIYLDGSEVARDVVEPIYRAMLAASPKLGERS